MIEFKDYYKEKPEKEGYYVWRLPHNKFKDLNIVFVARMRMRGAGYTDVLSPEFDLWDGYNVILPPKIEWSEFKGNVPTYTANTLYIEELENKPCPFCKKIPSWIYSGRWIGASPIDSKYWYLKCCNFVSELGMKDPRILTKIRNEALKQL